MGEQTNISWTNHTFNPWWGCWKISDECKNCYAEAFDHRLGGEHWGRTAPRKFNREAYWREPLKWDAAAQKAGERRRVFCASMSDVFERHPDPAINAQMDEARARLFALIRQTPWLDWLLLTKRPESFATMLPWALDGEPWLNVWLGVTAGVRSSLERIAILRRTPAAVHFVSCEPLLEDIAASDWDWALDAPSAPYEIDWLIVGDESGHGARSADPAWVATARDAAARHGVAFHFKQWAGSDHARIGGERVKGKRHLPLLDDKQHAAFPVRS
jgi:protein gp37